MKKLLLIILMGLISTSGFSQTRPSWLQLRDTPFTDIRAVTGATIEEKLEACTPAMGDIVIPQDTYKFSRTATIASGVSLVAETGAVFTYVATGNHPLLSLSDSVTLSNIIFTGLADHTTGGDAGVSSYALVDINAGSFNRIKDCSFLEISDYGVQIRGGGDSNTVRNCKFKNTTAQAPGTRGRHGVGIVSVGVAGRSSDGNIVTDCQFKNLSIGVVAYSNVAGTSAGYFGEVANTRVVNSVIDTMSEHGIYISSGNGVYVQGCHISGVNNGSGIIVRSKGGIISQNNVESDSGGINIGAPSSNVLTDGNTVVITGGGITSIGINLEGSNINAIYTAQGVSLSDTMSGNVISRNIIRAAETATSAALIGIRSIASLATESAVLKRNVIDSNIVIDFPTGMWLRYTDNFIVRNNSFRGDDGYKTAASPFYGSGISVTNGNTSLEISNNTVASYSVYGVVVTGAMSGFDSFIKDNRITECASYALDVSLITSGSGYIRADRNSLVGNPGGMKNPVQSDVQSGNYYVYDSTLMNESYIYDITTPPTSTPTHRGAICVTATSTYISESINDTSAWRLVYP